MTSKLTKTPPMMKILVKAMTTINKMKNKSDQNFDRWSKVQFDVQTHAPKLELKAKGETRCPGSACADTESEDLSE